MGRTTFAVAAAMLAFVVAGCGNGGDYYDAEPTDVGPPHNPGDVYFSQTMIRSHQQSIEMSKLAAKNSGSDEVKRLAADIEAADEQEVATMRGWLKDWGEGKGSGDEFPGMVSGGTKSKLEQSDGAAFDRVFLTAMVAGHKGAIALATSVKSEGIHSPTADLANALMSRQRAEVAQMRKMLGAGT